MATVTSEKTPFDLERAVDRAQGSRDHQEDDFAILDYAFPTEGWALFGVFDGHGGSSYSAHARKNLFDFIIGDENFKKKNYIEALTNAFHQENKAMKEMWKSGIRGGTTATVALVTKKHLYLANVGDSRAVLCERKENDVFKARRISRDHSFTDAAEKSRVIDSGGEVIGNRVHEQGHAINMTRALGDFEFKAPYNNADEDYISPAPTIILVELIPSVQFAVLASDGLWGFMEDQQVVDELIRLKKEGGNTQTVSSNFAKGLARYEGSDNITVLTIQFKWPDSEIVGCETRKVETILKRPAGPVGIDEDEFKANQDINTKKPKVEVVETLEKK